MPGIRDAYITSLDSDNKPMWRNGIRDGLKNRWSKDLVGSNPTIGIINTPLAQRTEHVATDHSVGSSNLSGGTISSREVAL